MSKSKTTITVQFKPIYDYGTGHRERPGRAGTHQHRSTKRNRTRSDQKRRAIDEH